MSEALNRAIAKGAIWSVSLGLLNKVVTFVGQFGLAWLLAPEHFGLAAIALAFLQISNVYSAGGIKTFLVQNSGALSVRSNSVFWASVAMNLLIGGVLFSQAKSLSIQFASPELTPLLKAIAIAVVINGFSTVFFAALQGELKFKVVSTINMIEGFLQTVTALGLAYLDFGASSIILPRIFTSITSLLLSLSMAQRVYIKRPNLQEMVEVYRSAFPLFLYSLLSIMVLQAPILMIGRMADADTVGLYYWGVQMSTQAIFLLSTNLREVYIPALIKAEDSREGAELIFTKSLFKLNVLVCIIAAAQYLSAEFLVRALFDLKWAPAIEVIKWTSLGLLLTPLNTLSISWVISRKLNAAAVLLVFIQIGIMVLAVYLGAKIGGLATIATFYAAGTLIGNLISGILIFRFGLVRFIVLIRNGLVLPIFTVSTLIVVDFIFIG